MPHVDHGKAEGLPSRLLRSTFCDEDFAPAAPFVRGSQSRLGLRVQSRPGLQRGHCVDNWQEKIREDTA